MHGFAERFAAANQVDDQSARTVVRQCLAYVANAMNGLDPYEECSSTPIFASGRSDVPEATQHDTEALAQNPAWGREVQHVPGRVRAAERRCVPGDPDPRVGTDRTDRRRLQRWLTSTPGETR